MSFLDDPRSDDTRERPSRGRGGELDGNLVDEMRSIPATSSRRVLTCHAASIVRRVSLGG